MAKLRTAKIHRVTKETDISLSLKVDGKGKYKIETPIPFFNHMMETFSRHGFFDMDLKATGDVHVDDHHLVEDVGLVLGEALKKAIGQKLGMRRYGHFTLPMDETLAYAAVDFCGRPCLVYRPKISKGKIKNFDLELVLEFFQALTNAAEINLHVGIHEGKNKHHMVEAMFKAVARAIDMALEIDSRIKKQIPSTKGSL